MTIGMGSEVAAIVAEKALEYLKAPIMRVTGFDVPMPIAKSESYNIPSVERIKRGVEEIFSYIA